MLAYYAPPHDTSMQSVHYHQPPASSASEPFDHFDNSSSDLSSYFLAFDGLQDHQMSQLTIQQPHNPPIRVQQSTPPANARVGANRMMRTQSNLNSNAVSRNHPNVGLLSPIQISSSQSHTNGGHKRSSSGSSVTSATPTSPLDHTRSYPHVASSEPYSPSASEYLDHPYTTTPHSDFSKSLPTPIETPNSTTQFFNKYNFPIVHDADLSQYPMAMRRSIFDQASGDDDGGSYQHSTVSSMSHNSPKTPLTAFPDEFDDGSKGLQTGETKLSEVDKWMDEYLRLDDTPDFNFQVPISRSVSNIHDDLLMDSPSPTSAPQQKSRPSMSKSGGLLDSHYREVFNNRLQHAQQGHVIARSQSPSTTVSGEQSPFRHGSPYATQSTQSFAPQRSPQPRMTVSQLRQQQKAGEEALEMAQHQPAPEETPKTISPKDAVYEYHQTPEEAAMPLFPQDQHMQQYGAQYPTPLTLQQQPMSSQPEQSYGSMPTARRESSNFSANYGYMSSQPQSAQGYAFANPLMRQESSMQNSSDRTPEFPAHLRSMESSVSDAMTATPSIELPQRPVDTSSDAGTYSCTYHGCPHRFESPAKLQKHKREAHRQTTPSGMTSSAVSRNSQAGPHRCTRLNPSTGKPCNSEFSRPYDLTRHEDTIHNNRKMKVRCHLCQEEKTFSRNDALTRHMRVVHPEIEWPGKTRRKNARD